MTEMTATAALPKPKRDFLPVLLPAVLALAMLPLIGSGSSWVTLTVASLAMGMMIFIMASGLTLVFGLMDVLNFGHGAFISVGAYIGTLVLLPLASWVQADSLLTNLAVLAPAAVLAMAVSGALGLVVERVLILPVYGQHLKQILMTTGGLIVAEQALYALWGPQIIPLPLPTSLRGSFIIGDIAIANGTSYGLAAGLWSADTGRAHRVAARIDAGIVWVNTYRYIRWSTPYGGMKMSGWGRENGIEALDAYLETKTTVVSTTGVFADPFAS